MAKREIRPIGPEVVEQYLEVYLNAYPAFKSLDDECRQFYREKTVFDMTNDKEVDFVGMFDGEKLIIETEDAALELKLTDIAKAQLAVVL